MRTFLEIVAAALLVCCVALYSSHEQYVADSARCSSLSSKAALMASDAQIRSDGVQFQRQIAATTDANNDKAAMATKLADAQKKIDLMSEPKNCALDKFIPQLNVPRSPQ